jgi:4-amino-4-deoxy-L-arabinose transferase-like glycosyltransferase
MSLVRPLKPLAWVFVLGLGARVGAQVFLGAYAHAETWEYEDIANSLLAGHGYTYSAGNTTYVAAVSSPLYVLLTAGVYLVTSHSQAAMLVLQALFGAATAVLAGWLAARVFQPEAAWTAGGLVAVDPGLAVYATKLHPLTLDALTFMVVLCASVSLPARHGWGRMAVLGGCLGLAALTRTTILSFVPVFLLWARRFKGIPLLSRSALALLVTTALVYGAWPVRNSIVLGQFLPGSSESTEWLWRGTNPLATGSSWTATGETMLQAAPPDFRAQIAAASEAERIGLYRDAAFRFIREQPGDAVRLYLTKLGAFWWGSNSTGLQYPSAWTPLNEAWYAAVLALAALGVWWGWKDRATHPTITLIVASLLLVSASQAVFYVEGRHRLAVEPLLLVLSGVGTIALARLPWSQPERQKQSLVSPGPR